MNKGINLLDYKNKVQPKKASNKQRSLRIIAVILLFLVSVFSMIIFILVTLSPLPQLRQQQKIASFNLTLSHQDIIKLALVKERAGNIQDLIDKRPYYDKVLSTIQAQMPSGVGIDAVDINKDNFSVTFSSNSLLQLDNFLNKLTQNDDSERKFSKFKIENLSTDEKQSGFLLTVSLKTNE